MHEISSSTRDLIQGYDTIALPDALVCNDLKKVLDIQYARQTAASMLFSIVTIALQTSQHIKLFAIIEVDPII